MELDGIAVSYNMSVDVFGRNLKRAGGSRDPPGVGFKVTSSGQYDIDNKRLCNIAEPKHFSDAVNLDALQRIVRMEITSIHEVIAKLRKDLDNLNLIVEADRDEIDAKLLGIQYVLRSKEEAASSS